MSRPRPLKHGSLCTGYGGLDTAAQAVFGGELAWWSDIHPAAVKVMTHHQPAAPNLGDLRNIVWWDVPPVQVLTAGYPCQPFSNAGLRLGTEDARHLWPWVARAIGALRPEIVVLENVSAHLGRGFDVVLADLAVLGYDAAWTVVRASDVGAPHRRARLFIVAADADRTLGGRQGSLASGPAEGVEPEAVRGTGRSGSASAADTARAREHGPGDAGAGWRTEPTDGGEPAADTRGTGCGPGVGIPGPNGTAPLGDSPSAAADTEGIGWGEGRTESAGLVGGSGAALSGHGSAADADCNGKQQRQGDLADVAGWAGDGGEVPLAWGQYGPAVHRWERAIGWSAPAPTVTGKRGGQQLSPMFVEWMMGLDAGHVTAVPGLSRNDMLHVLGNGVVSQCATWAVAELARRLGLVSNVERAA